MTLVAENPIDTPEAYDVLLIGGSSSPGICRISGLEMVWVWDIKDAAGNDGASSALKGRKLSKFTATFTFWTREHFAQWDVFREQVLLSSIKGDKVTALPAYHPKLARYNVKAISIEKIGDETRDEKDGRTRVAVDFIQYSPPKPKPAFGAGGRGPLIGIADPFAKWNTPAGQAELAFIRASDALDQGASDIYNSAGNAINNKLDSWSGSPAEKNDLGDGPPPMGVL